MRRLLEAIQAENDQILATMEKLEDSTAGEPDARQRLLEELRELLDERREMDERFVYPVFTSAEAGGDLVERSRQELVDIDRTLEALHERSMDSVDVKFDIENLSSTIRQHVEHEARELLPQAERLLSAEEESRLAELAAAEFEPLARRLRVH